MDETGQAMTEYAVVLSLIVLVTVVAFTSLAGGIEGAFNAIRSVLP